eukprot:11911355-Alexandrium_andersonii.AAC.1
MEEGSRERGAPAESRAIFEGRRLAVIADAAAQQFGGARLDVILPGLAATNPLFDFKLACSITADNLLTHAEAVAMHRCGRARSHRLAVGPNPVIEAVHEQRVSLPLESGIRKNEFAAVASDRAVRDSAADESLEVVGARFDAVLVLLNTMLQFRQAACEDFLMSEVEVLSLIHI